MTHYKSIIYVLLAMFAFAMMALFTREANADVLTIATWRAILVAMLFGLGAITQGELRFFTSKNGKDDDEDDGGQQQHPSSTTHEGAELLEAVQADTPVTPTNVEQQSVGINDNEGGQDSINSDTPPRFADLSALGLLSPEHLRVSIPYGLFLALASSTFVGGYAFTTIANTIFLHNLAPLFAIPLVFWLFRERTSANVILGAVISVLGVGLISGVSLFHASHFTNPRYLLGDFLSLVSAVGYAGVLVWTQLCRKHNLPILGTLFVSWSTAALVLVTLTLFLGTMSLSLHSFWWVLGLAFFCTNLPFTLLSQGMKKVPAGMASLLSMSEVLFATILGVALYNETLAPIGWLGGLLVTLGVLYPFMQKQMGGPAEQPSLLLRPYFADWSMVRRNRVIFWIGMLNLTAVVGSFLGGFLVSALSLLVLLHISYPSVSVLLDHKLERVQQSVLTVFAIVLGVLLLTGTWQVESVLSVLLLLLGVLAETYFLQREQSVVKPSIPDAESSWVVNEQRLEGDTRSYLWIALLAGLAGLWEHRFAELGYLLVAFGGTFVLMERMLHWWKVSLTPSRIQFPQSRKTVGGLILIAYFVGGIYIVPTGHQGLVERLGVRQTVVDAGLSIRFPPPVEKVHLVDVKRVQSLTVFNSAENLLCADQSMLTLRAVLEFVVDDVAAYEYDTKETEQVLVREARRIIVNQIRQLPHEMVFQDRGVLAKEWQKRLQDSVTSRGLGVAVDSLQILEVNVPVAVKDNFLDVVSAKEDQNTSINQAHAYAAASLPRALGDAVSIHEYALSEELSILGSAEVWSLLQDAKRGTGTLYLDWIAQDVYGLDTIRHPVIRMTDEGTGRIFLGETFSTTVLQTGQNND